MMTHKRAQQILASYGANPEKWPVDERTALQHFLLTDTGLQKIQQQELQFDQQLTQLYSAVDKPDTQLLQKRILANLPDRKIRPHASISYFFSHINISILNQLLAPAKTTATIMIVMLLTMSIFDFNADLPILIEHTIDDEWLLMAEALDYSSELELLAVLEPELYEEL